MQLSKVITYKICLLYYAVQQSKLKEIYEQELEEEILKEEQLNYQKCVKVQKKQNKKHKKRRKTKQKNPLVKIKEEILSINENEIISQPDSVDMITHRKDSIQSEEEQFTGYSKGLEDQQTEEINNLIKIEVAATRIQSYFRCFKAKVNLK